VPTWDDRSSYAEGACALRCTRGMRKSQPTEVKSCFKLAIVKKSLTIGRATIKEQDRPAVLTIGIPLIGGRTASTVLHIGARVMFDANGIGASIMKTASAKGCVAKARSRRSPEAHQ
jgi:hypothetical protein